MRRKYFLGALAVLVCVSLGVVVGAVITKEKGYYSEVMAMMESDISNQEKMIFLEGRVNKEVGSLNILFKNSDLCSNKYLNELDTLRISMKVTIDGYDLISENVSSSEKIVSKYKDYKSMYEKYDELVDYIYDEKYDEALELVKEINELRKIEYYGIESEISKLGNN